MLQERGQNVAAIKPIETGCDPDPSDASALADACGKQHLIQQVTFYRARLPLAPYAITLETGRPGPDLDLIRNTILRLSHDHDFVLVEGAGGLLAPLDAQRSFADLCEGLDAQLILVCGDYLGTISHTLTCIESISRRRLDLSCVVLNAIPHAQHVESNLGVLQSLCRAPVIAFGGNHDLVRSFDQLSTSLALAATLQT